MHVFGCFSLVASYRYENFNAHQISWVRRVNQRSYLKGKKSKLFHPPKRGKNIGTFFYVPNSACLPTYRLHRLTITLCWLLVPNCNKNSGQCGYNLFYLLFCLTIVLSPNRRGVLQHWLHGNSIPKIGCHYFWPGLIALPKKNTLPMM
jgi:hypothetical protein